jgi:hypothetical protein
MAKDAVITAGNASGTAATARLIPHTKVSNIPYPLVKVRILTKDATISMIKLSSFDICEIFNSNGVF